MQCFKKRTPALMAALIAALLAMTVPSVLSGANDPGARWRGGHYDGYDSTSMEGATLPPPQGTILLVR